MGRYSNLGRVIGGIDAFALAGVGAYTIFTPAAGAVDGSSAIGLSAYTISVSALVFVVEMPALCMCIKACAVLSKYTSYIAGLWFGRAVMYTLIAAGAFGIYTVRAPSERVRRRGGGGPHDHTQRAARAGPKPRNVLRCVAPDTEHPLPTAERRDREELHPRHRARPPAGLRSVLPRGGAPA